MTDKADNDALVRSRYLSDRFDWAAPGDQQEDVWLLRFCDNDVRDAMWTGPDAEAEAWVAWNRHAPGYNCYLFRLAALRTPQPEVGETGWLIELPLTASAGGRLCWVALEDGPFPLFRTLNHGEDYDFQKIASPLRFTPESDEALRFARKVDAENFMAKFDRYLLHAVVTEHAWPEATRPQPDEAETLRAEVARLREALTSITKHWPDSFAARTARAALKGTDHGRG